MREGTGGASNILGQIPSEHPRTAALAAALYSKKISPSAVRAPPASVKPDEAASS